MDPLEGAGLAAAAFAAGAINAVAGGGSLISFPALVAAGYSSKVANVTNSVALWPGYVGGSLGYRQELGLQRRTVRLLAVPSIAGAVAGSAILLATPSDAFDRVVPFLILFACLLMATQDRIGGVVARRRAPGSEPDAANPGLLLATFVLGIYGAYFGAGLGILTLAVLGILLPDDAQHSNALKGMLSLIMNAVAVIAFVAFGPVRWAPAALMAVAALAGGYLGVGVARKLGKRWLRLAVIVYGLAAAIVMFLK
jgi:uncharacterized protein